jgi:hypothetical protein
MFFGKDAQAHITAQLRLIEEEEGARAALMKKRAFCTHYLPLVDFDRTDEHGYLGWCFRKQMHQHIQSFVPDL